MTAQEIYDQSFSLFYEGVPLRLIESEQAADLYRRLDHFQTAIVALCNPWLDRPRPELSNAVKARLRDAYYGDEAAPAPRPKRDKTPKPPSIFDSYPSLNHDDQEDQLRDAIQALGQMRQLLDEEIHPFLASEREE